MKIDPHLSGNYLRFKRISFGMLFCALILTGLLNDVQPGRAAASEDSAALTGQPLCMPGIYLTDPEDCLPLGPSSYLSRMAALGITFPLLDLDAVQTDPALGNLPFNYAILSEGSNPVYATIEDAMAGTNPISEIGPGQLKYISYTEFQDTDNGRFFHLKSGGWVEVSSRVSVPRSFPGGVLFDQTPERSFGWILPFNTTVRTKRTPGYNQDDYTDHEIAAYDRVQIYAVEAVGDTEWYLVGPDEWLDQRVIGRVLPNPNSPEGVTNGRWIEVNLYEQTLSVYEQNKLVFATLIASGMDPFFTRPGLFQVYKKHESTPMSGAFEADRSDYYLLQDVPWTLYYDEARALHGAYWRTAFGYPQSHGCVNLAPGDAHWLFDWAQDGEWVYVWDPSGSTPTDPNYYTPGGA